MSFQCGSPEHLLPACQMFKRGDDLPFKTSVFVGTGSRHRIPLKKRDYGSRIPLIFFFGSRRDSRINIIFFFRVVLQNFFYFYLRFFMSSAPNENTLHENTLQADQSEEVFLISAAKGDEKPKYTSDVILFLLCLV